MGIVIYLRCYADGHEWWEGVVADDEEPVRACVNCPAYQTLIDGDWCD